MSTHLPMTVGNANIMTDGQFQGVRDWLDLNESRRVRLAADALKLLEEAIELCYVSGAYVAEVEHVYNSETFKALQRGQAQGHYNPQEVEEEIGDVSLCLAAFIQKAPINSMHAVSQALKKVHARQWGLDEFGVLRRPDRNPHPYKEGSDLST